MPFLTIFSAPKPFTDPHVAIIQRNAIRSWLHLGDEVEVLLVGDEPGLSQVATELGVRQLPQVQRNEQGTPLVSSIFDLARQASQSPLLAYLNADILAMPDLVSAAQQVAEHEDRFLIIGQRWDLDVRQELDFDHGWPERLRLDVQKSGALHRPAGSDYFIFPKALYTEMPGFAIGRAGWDNWTIYHARRSEWAVVDATASVMIVHQSHDYSHLPGGKAHYNLDESQKNMDIGGGIAHMYTVLEANRCLVNGSVRPVPLTLPRLLRQVELRLAGDSGKPQGIRRTLWRRVRRLRRKVVRLSLEQTLPAGSEG